MSILDRDALEQSPLADLHTIASELSIDGYRRLRKADLIDAILGRQGGEVPPEEESDAEGEPDADVAVEAQRADDEERPARRRRGRRGGRGRSEEAEASEPAEEEAAPTPAPDEQDVRAEGVVELLPNGSGFLRVNPPDPSEDDVYISAAQVKRCELVSGDRVAGPRRPPRRSERFASLVRVDTINDQPASEVADSARFDELEAAFPDERFRLGSDDPTVKALEWLTPFGRGSRVTIAGPARAGKTEALRRLAAALVEGEDQVSLVLAGVRPEEIFEWARAPLAPAAALSFVASADAQGQTVERIVDQARRLATRGAHAVVLIDTLDGMAPAAARKVLGAARNIVGGGSLTIIATALAPLGGETTVIALDPLLTSTGRFPAIDLASSWTLRPELLVGEAGAEAIARARAEALES
jgi:transcription termination factor Rho